MTVFGIPIRELIVGLLAIFSAAFVAWNRAADNKARNAEAERVAEQEMKFGLDKNPTRCNQHGEDIAGIKKDIDHIQSDIRDIQADIREIREKQK
jgi:hypothetical protein